MEGCSHGGKWKIHGGLMKEWRLQHVLSNIASPKSASQPSNSTVLLLIISQTPRQVCPQKDIKTPPFVHVLASVTESLCVVSIPLPHHTGWSQGTISVLLVVTFRGLLTRVRGIHILRLHIADAAVHTGLLLSRNDFYGLSVAQNQYCHIYSYC